MTAVLAAASYTALAGCAAPGRNTGMPPAVSASAEGGLHPRTTAPAEPGPGASPAGTAAPGPTPAAPERDSPAAEPPPLPSGPADSPETTPTDPPRPHRPTPPAHPRTTPPGPRPKPSVAPGTRTPGPGTADLGTPGPRSRDGSTTLRIGSWSARVVRGGQEEVDACRDAVQWTGPALGTEDGYALRTAVVVGHDHCGFDRFATLPVGTDVTATTPRGTFTYRVYAHHVSPGRGTPSHGLYWGDLTLQSCIGPDTGFSYLMRV
ncbi:hypothetical protein AB0F77_01450 [Streptomyces sp. NPDC026672]|uniref:hypothetical protein n=1 Tax=unclassified Streptomyces TaxID=2593676 RepID=UPI0033FFBB1D